MADDVHELQLTVCPDDATLLAVNGMCKAAGLHWATLSVDIKEKPMKFVV